jgi:dipeptidyl aminopeptidase/acylaminoacyl peptidase
MFRYLSLIFLFPILLFPQKSNITIDDLWAIERIGSFDVSPDGSLIVFSATIFSMDLNKGNSDIYILKSDGTGFKPLKNSEKSESEPKFSPDGKRIAYTLGGQIRTCNIDGSDDKQLTDLYSGVSGFEWSADGSKILFVSPIYPECLDQDCVKKEDEKREQSKVKATLFTELMYRHWNDWRGDKRSHLFVYDLKSQNYYNLTLGSKADVPPLALGSSNDYNFSPDGREVAYATNLDEMIATSTNNEIFIADITNLTPQKRTDAKKISVSTGNDNQPVYSPDGKSIAFLSMKRAGFEADKQDIIIYDRASASLKNLTEDFDRSADEIIWSHDSRAIFFNAANEVNKSIYKLEVASGKIDMVFEKHVNTSLTLSPDGKKLFFKQQRSTLPYEIFSLDINGENLQQLTKLNEQILSRIELTPIETFWSEGAEGAKVQSLMVKPPFFDPDKKYPMIFLIHGGPQGHWNDDFHFRWNTQMFAAPGYVVVAPNPRGSTGYGQKFTDEISGDWGGKVYVDLMNAYDHAVNNFDFIDKNNTFAAGASYGGYMINWIAGHTDRFNALVSHAGVFNLESMYGTTEELWFPEWEFGGTPWEKRELYEKWSPHRYIHNATTPVLVTHGAYDFRVSEEQGMQLFTSLQRLGVDSQFLYFPDETHFIAKPQNARLWWNTIYGWFNRYYKAEGHNN